MIVDGVAPHRVAIPEDAAQFASALATASRDGQQTVIRGGGTKLDWGRTPATVDLLVSTSRLDRLIAHRHGDLTVTVQCGMPLKALNAALRKHKQWLPVESAFDEATAGGIVATNDAGPSRHRNGTPRDLVIGITLALTDGRLVKAGGTVVKNVAGYDLGKLVSGSHGTLAGIADVTFKLVPIPQTSATLAVTYTEVAALQADVAALWGSQVEPAAFDVASDGRTHLVFVRMATSPAATDAQVAAARALMSGEGRVVTGADEDTLWDAQIRGPWARDGAVVRFSWLPANLPHVLTLVAGLQAGDTPVRLAARVMGTGLLSVGGDAKLQAAAIARLRSSRSIGNVSVLRASREVKAAVDVWGPSSSSDTMARALKRMFDPAGVLNAGRGPI